VDREHLLGYVQPFANLQGLTLHDVDFSGSDLRGADFRGSDLDDTKFDQAKLQGAVFSDTNIRRATFSNASLEGSNFQRSIIFQASFKGATLDSREYQINGSSFLKVTTFELTYAAQSIFQGSSLLGVNFQYAVLREATFLGATIGIANWNEEHRDSYTDFRHCDMTQVDLRGVDLSNSIIGNSKLDMANMQKCSVKGQVFHELGSLWRTNLSGANLSNVICDDIVNMTDANLEKADFRDANLVKAVFSSGTRVKGAVYNKNTVWPDGFSPVGKGLILK
jgi:uncharacterized protein YjbI with pentapeptide repeats